MKTAVSMPDRLFEAAEQTAARLGLSRSELYATAIARFLREESGAEITAAIDRVLAKEQTSLDRVLARVQAASLGVDEGDFEDWVDVRKTRRSVAKAEAEPPARAAAKKAKG